MLTPKEPKPFKVNCFHCHKLTLIKYCRGSGRYSRKQNWGYWTETEENKDKYICGDCLLTLYYQHKWEFQQLIPNKEKQILLRQYIADDKIKGKVRKFFVEDGCPQSKKKNSSTPK